MGAIDATSGVDESVVECVDDERLDDTFVVTVDALFECADADQRRVVLLAIFGEVFDQLQPADIGLPPDLELGEFSACVRSEITSAPSGEIDVIWRNSTSSASLGELAVTTSATGCYGILTSSLVGEDALAPDDLFDAVIAGAGFEPAEFNVAVVEQESAVISFIEEPVQVVVVSTPDGSSVISAELRDASPPSESQLGAASAMFEVFGFIEVDPGAVLAQAPAQLAADGFVACLSLEDDGTGLRIQPTAIGCER